MNRFLYALTVRIVAYSAVTVAVMIVQPFAGASPLVCPVAHIRSDFRFNPGAELEPCQVHVIETVSGARLAHHE